MVMIQDSNQPSAHDKALRITGEPSKCQVLPNSIVKFNNETLRIWNK